MENRLITTDVEKEIFRILKRGDSVELKKENGKLVVVEIQRKVKTRTLIIG